MYLGKEVKLFPFLFVKTTMENEKKNIPHTLHFAYRRHAEIFVLKPFTPPPCLSDYQLVRRLATCFAVAVILNLFGFVEQIVQTPLKIVEIADREISNVEPDITYNFKFCSYVL